MSRIRSALLSFFRTFLPKRQQVTPDMDAGFAPIYARCAPYTMTSIERMYGLYEAVRYIIANDIPGDFVECGVWKGGSSMLIAETLHALGIHDRHLYLFDTFAGMPEPTAEDVRATSLIPATEQWKASQTDDHNEWCYASIEEVQTNMERTQYPSSHIHLIQGMVEETIPQQMPSTFALLRIDTDWHASTLHCLQQMYPALSAGGVLILDDYGSWAGARKATDEYFLQLGHKPLLARLDAGCRIVVKS